MKETLRETVVRECADCEAVAHAWVAGEIGFAVQTRVGVKSAVKRGDDGEWTRFEMKYVSSGAYREAQGTVARIRRMHPEADATLVTYRYHPGGIFVEVYRGAVRVEKSDDEEDS